MKRLSLVTAVAVALLLAAGCDNKKPEVAQQAPEIKPATPKVDEPAPLEPLEARPTKTVKAPRTTDEPGPMEVVTPGAPTTPAPAATNPPPTSKSGAKTYTVQKGDTLTSISRKLYNTPKRVKDIIAANPGINPNKIKPGQVINLPN